MSDDLVNETVLRSFSMFGILLTSAGPIRNDNFHKISDKRSMQSNRAQRKMEACPSHCAPSPAS